MNSLRALFAAISAIGALSQVSVSAASAQEVQGWATVIWRVAPDPKVPVTSMLFFADDAGSMSELVLDEGALRAIGGVMAIDRRRVGISGISLPAAPRESTPARLRASAVRLLDGVSGESMKWDLVPRPQSGSKPYVTILCRFADSLGVEPRRSIQFYQNLLLGTAAPSLDHYWREASYERINLTGSAIFGWYNLPSPRSEYFVGGQVSNPNLTKLMNECTGAADADVDFSKYFGVNLQFDQNEMFNYGGLAMLTRDGLSQFTPMTWMASWAGQHSYVQNMGSTFGLPHSSGPYSATFDSGWDPMSRGFTLVDGEFIATGTISFNKDLLGWIPSIQKYVAPAGSSRIIRIQRLALPTSSSDYLMAQVPIRGTNMFYTVEARKFAGYDVGIPGEAILIHKVNPAVGERTAQVVDEDGDGDPDDEGARWLPGEVFVDAVNNVSIRVVSASSDGFDVSIQTGAEPVLIGTAAVKVGAVGLPYADTLKASGGIGTISWSVSSGSLPPGVGLAASTGVLSGLPSAAGAFNFVVTAIAGSESSTKNLTANIYEQVAILGDSVRRTGVPTKSYADTLRVIGGNGAYTWSVTAGALPAGLTLGTTTGILSGVPTSVGETRLTVSATSVTLTASKQLKIPIEALLQLSSTAVRSGSMGAAYADTLTASGGTGTWSWSLTSGALPSGVSLDAASGVLSGIPAQAGTFSFQASVRSGAQIQAKSLTINVVKPVLQAERVFDHYLGAGGLTNDQIRFLDLLGNRNSRFDVGDIRAWLLDTAQIAADIPTAMKELIGETPPKPSEKK